MADLRLLSLMKDGIRTSLAIYAGQICPTRDCLADAGRFGNYNRQCACSRTHFTRSMMPH